MTRLSCVTLQQVQAAAKAFNLAPGVNTPRIQGWHLHTQMCTANPVAALEFRLIVNIEVDGSIESVAVRMNDRMQPGRDDYSIQRDHMFDVCTIDALSDLVVGSFNLVLHAELVALRMHIQQQQSGDHPSHESVESV